MYMELVLVEAIKQSAECTVMQGRLCSVVEHSGAQYKVVVTLNYQVSLCDYSRHFVTTRSLASYGLAKCKMSMQLPLEGRHEQLYHSDGCHP
jgi:hypothetical protein